MEKFLQLAPMQAMTDIIFMNTYHRIFGNFNEMMAPYLMASTKSYIKASRLDKLYGELNPNIRMIPQLLSNESEGFLHYANLMHEKGYKTVNWNLGCPYPFVAKKKRGSGLLPYPDTISKILDELSGKLKPKLSVKIRLGYYEKNEILPIIDILNNHDVHEVIIHPRTAAQKYEGNADRDYFGEIYQRLTMPVVYNGDIIRKEQVYEMDKIFPDIKGYMIGRGAFINPFITNQINGVEDSHETKIEKYKDLYFSLHDHYKEKTINDFGFLSRMKELWTYFSQSFEEGESYFSELKTINDIEAFENTAKRIFEKGRLLY